MFSSIVFVYLSYCIFDYILKGTSIIVLGSTALPNDNTTHIFGNTSNSSGNSTTGNPTVIPKGPSFNVNNSTAPDLTATTTSDQRQQLEGDVDAANGTALPLPELWVMHLCHPLVQTSYAVPSAEFITQLVNNRSDILPGYTLKLAIGVTERGVSSI